MTIEPGVLAALLGWAGTVIAALAYVIKTRADIQREGEKSRGDVAKTEAASDGRLTEAILSLAQSLNANSQQAGIERQQTLMAIEKSGGRVEGMMVAIVDNTKTVRDNATAIKDMGTQLDEFGGRLQHIPQIKSDVTEIKDFTSSFETNLGDSIGTSIGEQLEPVATALTGIGTQLGDLVREVRNRDGEINERLTALIEAFQKAEIRLLKMLEPIVLRHMNEILTLDKTPETPVPNGSPINLPVDIHISSAPKENKHE